MREDGLMNEWAYRGYLSPELDGDAPARMAALGHMRTEATATAREQGYTLTGEPVVIEDATVIVPDWSEGEDGIVARDVASLVGLDPSELRPGPTRVVLRWTCDTPTADG